MTFKIPAGTVILTEGEVNLDMYRIVKGNAEVYSDYQKPEEKILGIIKAGSFFGELGFLTGRPSIYTVVAYSNLEIERIVMGEFKEYCNEHYIEVLALMRSMASSMYNLRFNLNLMSKDLEGATLLLKENRKNEESAESIREQFKKYNLTGMKSLSVMNIKI